MLNNQENKLPVLLEDLGMEFPTISSKQKKRFGIYKCQCGNTFKTQTYGITNGNTTSCGCIKIKHMLTSHRLYKTWCNMIYRCTNKDRHDYKYYGGKGITICERWKDVSNFIYDMYPSYQEGLTIDRIDNDGNYEPSNCRWIDMSTQCKNRRAIRSDNHSGYRGVNKSGNGWLARIMSNGVRITIGYFNSAKEAGDAFNNYVKLHNTGHNI